MDTFSPTYDEVAAGRVHESAVVVSIDKLAFNIKVPFDREELIGRAKKVQKGDGYVIDLPNGRGSQLYFADNHETGLYGSFNPSVFNNAWVSLDSVEALLGRSGLRAEISRFDIALTFPCEMKSLYMGLDFGLRRRIEHVGKIQGEETVYIGKQGKRFEIKVYNKTAEMRTRAKSRKNKWSPSFCSSRLEITVIPEDEMRVEDLPRIIDLEPFKTCTAYAFKFIKPKGKVRPEVWQNYFEFEQCCLRWGFWHTRKMLNEKYGGNFARKFGQFYELEEMKPTLDEIFQLGIRGFFNH